MFHFEMFLGFRMKILRDSLLSWDTVEVERYKQIHDLISDVEDHNVATQAHSINKKQEMD